MTIIRALRPLLVAVELPVHPSLELDAPSTALMPKLLRFFAEWFSAAPYHTSSLPISVSDLFGHCPLERDLIEIQFDP